MPAPKGKKFAQRAPKNPNTEPAREANAKAVAQRREEREENARNYGNHMLAYDDGRLLAMRIAEYIHRQHVAEEPCTMAGLAIACGITRDTFSAYRLGERSGLEVESDDIFSDDEETQALYTYMTNGATGRCRVLLQNVVRMADELLANERETRLYKQGRVADIFALKAQDGWQDDTTPHTLNQTLVINGNEQSAESALAQLGFGRLTDGE